MLAIGIVVDDAIVVVENVERNIEAGLSPREATYRPCARSPARSSPSRWCWCAVFVPIAFISGLTGQFYKQFALTIAISTVISADQLADAVAGAVGAAAEGPRRAEGPR